MDALGRVVKYLVGVWTLFIGGPGLLFCLFHRSGDGFAAFCVLLVGMAPLALMIRAGQASFRKASCSNICIGLVSFSLGSKPVVTLLPMV